MPTGGTSNVAGGASIASGGVAGQSNAPTVAGGFGKIPADATVTVALAPATTFQTLEGFGAAIGWYQATLTAHVKRAEIYQLIFGDLGLDVLRLRNTFGRAESGTAAKDKIILDAAAASLGRRPKILLTSWSPPAALKANDVEKCSGETTCTLKRTSSGYVYDEFATYWFDAVTAYRGLGIMPDWISIQNEPDYIPSGWEGCKLAYQENETYAGYPNALVAVSAKLATMVDAPKLIGPETLGVHWNKLQSYMPALDKSLLYAAAHHLYEQGSDGIWDWRTPGPDSFIPVMKAAKSVVGTLPLFQTEFQTDGDNDIEGGFETAWLIHNSLVEEGTSAWLYWDLVWGKGRGLVSLPDTTGYGIRDQYYALRHYSLFTDPGYIRIGASASKSNIRVSAFRSPDQKRVTIIALNVGPDQERLGFTLGDFVARTSTVYRTVFVPGSSTRWEPQAALETLSSLALPSRSVATVVLDG
jgi:glucuronoarabinoxylan endo-1,4-beta-xylanase